MKAWMPVEATYVTCRVAQDILPHMQAAVLAYVTKELGGAPDEWRWELDLNDVVLTAARRK